MAKKKLLDDIKTDPSRFYRLAGDVARDRRFDDAERLEILTVWAQTAEAAYLPQIQETIAAIRQRQAAKNEAAE
jgi:hypothetical protein